MKVHFTNTNILFLGFLIFISGTTTFSQSYETKELKVGKGTENVFVSDIKDNFLFYCSDKKLKSKSKVKNENNTPFLDLYQVEESKANQKGKASIRLDSTINTEFNEGPIIFSKNSNKAYYSSNTWGEDSTKMLLSIFEITIDSNSGSALERKQLFTSDALGNYGHPSISQDGKILIFTYTNSSSTSSNLYYSQFIDNEWSNPKPMNFINTDANETFARFIENDIVFASDRDGGLGGLDLYRTSFNPEEKTEIVPLPEPLNSTFDDFCYIEKDYQSGYFSSNRFDGTDKIFSFELNLPKPDEFLDVNINLCYDLSDENYFDTLLYELKWDLGDGTTKTGKQINHCFEKPGKYQIQADLTNINTEEIDQNIINETLDLTIDAPIIVITEKAEKTCELSIDQQWSSKKYNNQYWLVNNQVLMQKSVILPSSKIKETNVKVVMWSDKDEKTVIGITKNISLK